MNTQLPYVVRRIDDNLTITDEILSREHNFGALQMRKKLDNLQKFFNEDCYRFNWYSVRKDSHTIEFFATVETPNEEGSWI